MNIFQELTELRVSRLEAERYLLEAALSEGSVDESRALPVATSEVLNTAYDEIDELHEIMLQWLYRNRADG